MKKNNKGFTLIELLVVVAIIGILAAVGVVAYSGYTSSAKKNAVKTMHSQTVKFISAELQKCSLEGTSGKAFGATSANCPLTATAAVTAMVAYSQDKNPHDTSAAAVVDSTAAVKGQISIKGDNTAKTIAIKSCIDDTCSTAGNTLTASVSVE